jgi:hypothetical protein
MRRHRTAALAAVAAALLAWGAPPAGAEPYDIPWFLAHPEERRAWLRRCHEDVALAQTRECQNAERAGAGAELGRPAQRDARPRPALPPVPLLPEFQPWPRTRSADRAP